MLLRALHRAARSPAGHRQGFGVLIKKDIAAEVSKSLVGSRCSKEIAGLCLLVLKAIMDHNSDGRDSVCRCLNEVLSVGLQLHLSAVARDSRRDAFVDDPTFSLSSRFCLPQPRKGCNESRRQLRPSPRGHHTAE